MSFYGTAFYEFSKVFYKFLFKNRGETEEELNTIYERQQDIPEMEASDKWDILSFESGNRWINLTEAKNGIIISHGAPANEALPVEEEKILSYGENFPAVNSLTIDKTGHVAQIKTVNYTLPEFATTQVEVDNSITPNVELEAGDILKFTIPNTGEIAYKLPISQSEINVQDLQGRMAVVEADLTTLHDETLEVLQSTTLNDYLSTNYVSNNDIDAKIAERTYTKTDVDSLLLEVNNKFDDKFITQDGINEELNTNHETLKKAIGDLTNIADTYGTLVDSIGDLSTVGEELNPTGKENIVSMLVNLSEQISENTSLILTTQLAIDALNTKIEALTARVEALETV